eukprot:CAMPEP_0117430062 /NCGR_PEP_ID=MMETSP0758-20121206/9585_1 /TAXON_ID=63605 /ORGANISM="Percolomonas cosmopolitus, Strain AE-1 (ATCC 50343)" /LENGTH=404 /DNA_ID=CAMNT_0005217673 /DNA_START=180 /DNA_END=1390 /DNA_ORIENTATION=+
MKIPGPARYSPKKMDSTGFQYTMGSKLPYYHNGKKINVIKQLSRSPKRKRKGTSPSKTLEKTRESPIKRRVSPKKKRNPDDEISEEEDEEEGPGPGAYNTNISTINHNGGVTIKRRYKPVSLSSDSVPGPGSYNTTLSPTKRGIKFEKSRRFKYADEIQFSREDTTIVGPGSYKIKSQFEKGLYDSPKGATIGGKAMIVPEDNVAVPGPGSYEKEVVIPSKKGFSFTKKLHSGSILDKDPSIPGPGTYETVEVRSAKAATFKGRTFKELEVTPGPGLYHQDAHFGQSGKKYTMGIRSDGLDMIGEIKHNPGPGAYLHKEFVGSEAPSYSLGLRTSPVKLTSDIAPGPGAYEYDRSVNTKTGRTIGTKFIQASSHVSPIVDNPGPGQYETAGKTVDERKGFTFKG